MVYITDVKKQVNLCIIVKETLKSVSKNNLYKDIGVSTKNEKWDHIKLRHFL